MEIIIIVEEVPVTQLSLEEQEIQESLIILDRGDFTVRRIPDSDREQVAGDHVSVLKRPRPETASSIKGKVFSCTF